MIRFSPPPLQLPQAAKPVLTPMVLSVLVCPGAGQFMQRRWLAGSFFVVTSLGSTAWLLTNIYYVLKTYYGLAFDPLNVPVDCPGLTRVGLPFVVWLVIYVSGIVDTAMAGFRHQIHRENAGR